MTKNLGWIFLLVGLLAMGLGFGIGRWLAIPPSNAFLNSLHPTTTVFLQPQLLPPISLIDHHHQQFTLFNFARKWTFLFFGYTYCPDVCPQTLTILKQVHESLTRQGDLNNTQIVFVSVDPTRDTASQLATYVTYFNQSFLGVTGSPDQIAAFAHPLGIAYTPADSKGLIDHSATLLLIDPLLRLRASFLPPHTVATILSDFRKIRQYYAEECCLPPKLPIIK